MSKTVWTFTNQRELDKNQFIDYIKRKIFRTIRKYDMLPKDKIITMKNNNSLNYNILKKIIETKFQVKESNTPNILTDNLSEVAEDIFKNILQGNYTGPAPKKRPLYFLSDKELELYGKLTDIEGKKRNQDEKIQNLFEKFLKKNQDLELNVVKALSQFGE
ncbi:hypothetical protein KAS08_02830 [Candidatus Pacearchaeota archaeon]|nr:hypothetical protein [Candidatus Pacearchaeota archaeon]